MNNKIQTLFTDEFNYLSLMVLYNKYVDNEDFIPPGSQLLPYINIFKKILQTHYKNVNNSDINININNKLCELQNKKKEIIENNLNNSYKIDI